MRLKVSSKLMFLIADVSKNYIPYYSAAYFPSSLVTYLLDSSSHLFPIRILLTPSLAFDFISSIQFLILLNDYLSLIE